ncbi:MAG: transcription antitermination factor NusB [Pseudomonadota bacterium]
MPRPQPARRRKGAAPGDGTPARYAAAEAIAAITDDGATLQTALDSLGQGLDGRDSAFARAIVRTTIRRRGDIDWCLSQLMNKALPKKAAFVRAVLRMSAAQLLFMRQADHSAVNAGVAILKRDGSTGGFAGLANAVLRRLIRERDDLLARLPEEANTPPWLWARWRAHYGADAAKAIAEAHRQEPPLDLALAPGAKPPCEGVSLPTGGLRLTPQDVAALDGYDEGAFWVQDWAAQLPARLLGDVAGKTVLDLCAAPGGKTMQLASAGAMVTAVEANPERAERLAENLQRTRLSDHVTILVADAADATGTFDAVLLDAPCSSTGTLRRHPDVAWAKSMRDIESLAKVQARLLDAAVERVAPGGVLVYATCSLEPEEGEAQAARAAQHTGLTHDPITAAEVGPFATDEGYLRTLPFMSAGDGASDDAGPTGLDGFFAARLRKQ